MEESGVLGRLITFRSAVQICLPQLRDHMEKSKVIIIGESLAILFLIILTILIIQMSAASDTTAEEIEWCFAEYVQVDQAIISCINDEQGTLQECMSPWNQKAYLLAELDCRCFIFPDAEGCS